MKYGHIVDNNEIIDEVLVTYFKKPKSYTTEDMCEINTHGGNIVTRKILELCLKNGANLAEPGEFTKRAFLNGRIDLLQAESVIDVINAKSEREAKTGIKQLEGILSKKINEIKQEILDVMVNVDVSIDYPEYDVEEVTYQEISNMLTSVKEKLEKLEKSFDNGKLIKEGIKTAIIGKPNAGKSSLLNAILKEDRAIVTEYEGTTRDTIEEFVNIEGIPLKLIDTAGIRNAKDEVEKIGIAKSREIAKEADLIIAIFDSTKELSSEDLEILNLIKGKKSIVILNKIDLNAILSENDDRFTNVSDNILKLSALNGEGLEKLYETISKMFSLNEINLDNEIVITNLRHKNLISKALINVKKSEEAIEQNMPVDIIAIFIKDILESLGEITGEEVTENTAELLASDDDRWCLALVNEKHPLDTSYVPAKLTEISGGKQVDSRIADSLNKMLDDGKKAGLSMYVTSGYRSYEKQRDVFNTTMQDWINQGYTPLNAYDETKKSVAIPGTSEHATGLAVDIISTKYGELDEKQGDTEEQKWLMEHCSEYGFVLRFPQDKSNITGIIYEPWHYRYVGVDAAKEMTENGLTLEEYVSAN